MTTSTGSSGRRRWLSLTAVGVGLALSGWALLARSSEQEQLLEQLRRLERLVELEPSTAVSEPRAEALARELPRLFDREVWVSVPEYSQARLSRAELAPTLLRAQQDLERYRLELRVGAVELTPEQRLARVSAVAHSLAVRHGTAALERDERHARFTFVRGPGREWLLREIQVDTRSVIPD